ncbi:helix-turn-helix domain-containing protein [Paenibacillaceae bacterium]|nr:helix-turn-helix domain-containing protein [Paenibacillaceae bacterium]
MEWSEHIALWNEAHIHLIDIRHKTLAIGEQLRSSQLPASGYLFAVRGEARLQLDDVRHTVNGFYILHAGKGQHLQITPLSETFDYYLIYYKARLVFSFWRRPPEQGALSTAFRLPYGFVPEHPLLLYKQVEVMHCAWEEATTLGKLQAKGLFIQIIHQLLQQLQRQPAAAYHPGVVEQVVSYLQAHYAESITLDSVAGHFNYSSRYISKLFKREMGQGLIDYLIKHRIHQAQALLRNTDASVHDIAKSVGYADLFYFLRIFKKHTGMTPKRFKIKSRQSKADVYDAYDRTGLSIEKQRLHGYSDNEDENHYHYIEGESQFMFNRMRYTKAVTLLLGLTLLLSACSGGTSTNGGGTGAASNQPAATIPAAASEGNAQQPEQAFPRTYVDSTGREVVIDKQPERIAVGHFAQMEYFFSLGVPPVASPLAEEILQEFTVTLGELAVTAQVADLGDVMAPNLEKLLDEEPDLIIGSVGIHEDIYNELSQIAPVVLLDLSGEWYDHLREYASIIGKEETAEAYITELTEEMKVSRQALLPFKDETAGFFRLAGRSEFGAMGTSNYNYFFDSNEGLGLTAPDNYPAKWELMSLEGLSEINPDHLFIADSASNYEDKLAEFSSSEVWKSLKAVQNNQVHFFDIAAATNGPYAIKYAIKTIVDSMTQ